MNEKKLTEAEIMKALERVEEVCKKECPHKEGDKECMSYKCISLPPKMIIDLINRKNAEHKNLKKTYDAALKILLKEARAEAIKEFAEEAIKRTGMDYLIEELAKEMGVEEE